MCNSGQKILHVSIQVGDLLARAKLRYGVTGAGLARLAVRASKLLHPLRAADDFRPDAQNR